MNRWMPQVVGAVIQLFIVLVVGWFVFGRESDRQAPVLDQRVTYLEREAGAIRVDLKEIARTQDEFRRDLAAMELRLVAEVAGINGKLDLLLKSAGKTGGGC